MPTSAEKTKLYFSPVILVPVIISAVAFIFLSQHYTLDDALIYYRYIRNAINGDGLVYNIGERFNGLTSPLFTYISVLWAWLLRDIPISQTILCGIFLMLSTYFVIKIQSTESLSKYFILATSLLMVSNRFFYLTFGMETMMFLFLCGAAIYLYIKEKYFLLGIVAAAVFLTRGESLFLIISIIIFHFIDRRKFPDWKIFILPAIMIAANYIFNYLYYGELLQHTLSAKIKQGGSGLWRTWPFFRVSYIITGPDWKIFGHFAWLMFFMLVGISMIGVIFNIRKTKSIQILFAFNILYTGFYSILQVPSYPWYYTIYYYSAFFYFGYGLKTIYEKVSSLNFSRCGPAAAIITTAFGLIIIGSVYYFSIKQLPADQGRTEYKQAALWIKANTAKSAKIACVEIGHIGWYSERYIIDILGLVNKYNADFIGQKQFSKWLTVYTPDYIFLHDPLWDHEQGMKSYIEKKIWIPARDFDQPGYMLLVKSDEKKLLISLNKR